MTIDELKDNTKAWYGLDIDQLEIYSSVSNLLVKDPLNEGIINKRNFSLDTIVENIKLNIQHFKNNPKMLCGMPLMLDYEDNKAILDILIKNGLNIKKLEGFDSTIFCFPLKLVEIIEKILKFNNIPLILGNNINPIVKKIISMISKNHSSNINIVSRRIPYYIDNWQDYKPIIDDSKKREEYFLSTPKGKKIKQYEERIENSNQSKLYDYIMSNGSDSDSYSLDDNIRHK